MDPKWKQPQLDLFWASHLKYNNRSIKSVSILFRIIDTPLRNRDKVSSIQKMRGNLISYKKKIIIYTYHLLNQKIHLVHQDQIQN